LEIKISTIKKESRNRINSQIRAVKVRLIDEKGNQAGVVSFKDALQDAKNVGLDLVEISPNAIPPVVKIMNYGKFKYQQDKQKTIAKKKQKKIKIKEIKFRPGTDKGDYKIKIKSLRNFLEKGDKVKVTVWFRGREMIHQQLGGNILKKVEKDLLDVGKVEFFTKLEGRQINMILTPKKNNNIKINNYENKKKN